MYRIVACVLALAAALVATSVAATTFSAVNLRTDGRQPSNYSAGSDQPAITPDGRYVVFSASSPDLAAPTSSVSQVFLRDRVAGTTELVSVSNAGEAANAFTSRPSISDDGCRIVFMSNATNLAGVVASQNAFLRDRCTTPATTSLVSASTGGAASAGSSYEARISGDGKKIVFGAYGSNLVSPPLAGAGSTTNCLYVRDVNARTTSAIAPAGKCILMSSPDISRDGSRIVFWAYFSPATGDTVNGVWQIYLYDVATNAFYLMSSDASGNPQSQGGEGISTITDPAISSDGGYVAFRSRGAGLVSAPGGDFSHVYIKEIATGAIVRASVDSSGNPGNSHSSGYGQGYRPGLSQYAGTVTFLTDATNLAVETGGSFPNVVAHNPRTGQTVGFVGSGKTLNAMPAITDAGDTIVAASGYALDPAFSGRGHFAFPVLLIRVQNLVEYYYTSILRRSADASGLKYWAGEASRMDRLGVSVNEVAFGMAGTFFTSPEYASLNRDNSGFVTDLYTTFFSRTPDAAGLAYWKGQLDQGLPREVALSAFTFSAEFANYNQAIFGTTATRKEVDLVMDFYRGILGVLPDDGGFKYWLGIFRTAQCQGGAAVNAQVETISSAFVNSPQYGNRGRSTAQYVGDLFNAFLRRGGDLGGVQYWINEIGTGNRTRDNVRQQFVASPEFQSRVAAVIAQGCAP